MRIFNLHLMVPTEDILAEQHIGEFLSELFAPLEVRFAFVDRLKQKNKRAASYLEELKKRRLDVVIGTHRFDSKRMCIFLGLGCVITR